MRRETFIKAAENIVIALKAADIPDVLEMVIGPSEMRQRANPVALFNAFSSISVAYARFSEVEKTIMKIFGIERLSDSAFWAAFMTPSQEKGPRSAHEHVYRVMSGARFLINHMPKLLQLLRRASEDQPILVAEGKKQQHKILSGRLTFFIREGDAPSLTTRQFTEIIHGIDNLYSVVTRLGTFEDGELVVGALDSGSEKSLDVIGVAEAISKLSAFILECWDRVRYARAEKVKISIRAAVEGVSLLNEIKAAQEKNALPAEEAEKLRRTVVKSIDDLFAIGVYTREMQELNPIQPTQIEVQRRKLITVYAKEDKVAGEITAGVPSPDDIAKQGD